jgi:hypothetical protein
MFELWRRVDGYLCSCLVYPFVDLSVYMLDVVRTCRMDWDRPSDWVGIEKCYPGELVKVMLDAIIMVVQHLIDEEVVGLHICHRGQNFGR